MIKIIDKKLPLERVEVTRAAEASKIEANDPTSSKFLKECRNRSPSTPSGTGGISVLAHVEHTGQLNAKAFELGASQRLLARR